MKYSTLYPIVAGLALGAMLLPGTALAEKRTPFTSQENDTEQNFPWFPVSGTEFYMFGGKATFDMLSEESRVAGSGWYSMDAVVDPDTGVTLWGEFHIKNERGDWDGYWTGTEDGFTATLVGSREYKGLVSRWTSTAHGATTMDWSGYIVENGPGDVLFKISGWRIEELELIPGVPLVKASSFGTGGGQASDIGVFTDIKEIGLMDFIQGISRGMGTAQAANGDLFTWVSLGKMNSSGQLEISIFFAGGTGRFEHAVGSYAVQVQWTSQTSYTYKGTGTIRY